MSKIPFQKYGSINNLSTKKFRDDVYSYFPNVAKQDFVVLEKAHGAHFSFQTNGKYIECARRNSVLKDNDKFYDHSKLLERYKTEIEKTFKLVEKAFPKLIFRFIQIDGELIGGSYPHEHVKESYASKVQEGIYYCPDHQFYAYDIKYTDNGEDWCYINYDTCMDIFFDVGFVYAKPLQRGQFKDVINHDPTFQTTIPKLFNLPEIGGNIAEGVVIKPVDPMHFPNGSRVVFKNKTDKYSETNKTKPKAIVLEDFPAEVLEVQNEILTLININRLNNVISKIGEVTEKDSGKLIGLFCKDVLEDYQKEYGDKLLLLEKNKRKLATKKLAIQCKMVVLEYFNT